MIYDLEFEANVISAKEKLEWLIEKGKTIELKEKRKSRTISQNSYLHLILTWYAIEVGLTKEEAKHDYKRINRDIYSYVNKKNGNTYLKSSADLNTKEMTDTIDKFRNYCAKEAGIYIPSPDDTKFLEHIKNVQHNYYNFL